MPRHIDSKVYLISAGFLASIAFLMNGPSNMLGLKDDIFWLVSGQMLMGLCDAQLCVLPLPELMKQAKLEFLIKDITINEEAEINQYCATLFNQFIGVGQVLGPIFGALTFSKIGFSSTQDTVAMINLCYYSLYLIFGGGIEAFR